MSISFLDYQWDEDFFPGMWYDSLIDRGFEYGAEYMYVLHLIYQGL